MTTTATILAQAKQLLIDKGWTQHDYSKPVAGADRGLAYDFPERYAGCFCAMGAIYAAVNVSPVNDLSARSPDGFTAACALAAQVDPCFGSYTPSRMADGAVGQWNDAPGRTLTEVLAAFDAAISKEQAA